MTYKVMIIVYTTKNVQPVVSIVDFDTELAACRAVINAFEFSKRLFNHRDDPYMDVTATRLN